MPLKSTWGLYQHDENPEIRYWAEEYEPGQTMRGLVLYHTVNTPDNPSEALVRIKSPRNVAFEPDVYAHSPKQSTWSGYMSFWGFVQHYDRVSSHLSRVANG